MSHEYERRRNREKWENPPTNISAMVRLITRYMARVRRLRFFIKRTIDRRFIVAIATHTVRNTAIQVMHSDDESSMTWLLSLIYFFSLHTFTLSLLLLLNWIKFDYWEKKSRTWTNKIDVCFSKISNEDTWKITRRIRKLTFNLQVFQIAFTKAGVKTLVFTCGKNISDVWGEIRINWLTKSWGH